MKEVTVLATNIDVFMKQQEEKQEKQKADDTSAINARIEKIDTEIDHLKGKITEARDQAEKELDKEVKAINDKANELDQRLGLLVNENKNNVEELVSLKEANFAQLEKAKFVDALSERVNNMDAERQKSEALLIQKNEELITLNTNAIKDLEKLHDDRLDNLEQANKAALENTSQVNNSLTIMIEGLKSEHGEVKEAIQDLNEMIQQAEDKAKHDADTNQSKNNTIINEFKTDIENRYQNISIQYQDSFDKVTAENQKLRDDLNEVTVLATNIDVFVKQQEEKQEKQKADDTSAINARIEKIDTEIDHLKGKITEARDQAEKELDKEVKTINDKANELDQRLGLLVNENKNNVEELVSLKEANFAQLEKAKFVDALSERVNNMDAERQKSEALLIQKNEELIILNTNAIKDLEKLHDDRLDNLEQANKAALENTSQVNNSLTIMIEGLKSEHGEVKEAIQDLNEMIQQAEDKAKHDADTNQSKNNTIINEFKTDIENRYQNISIQYQDSFDKAMAENQKLKDDLNKLKGDNDTLGEIVENIQTTVSGLKITTKEKFESNEKNIQEINSFTTNIKLQM